LRRAAAEPQHTAASGSSNPKATQIERVERIIGPCAERRLPALLAVSAVALLPGGREVLTDAGVDCMALNRVASEISRDRPLARGAFAGSAILICYTFVGYPAIVALLARCFPRPVKADRSLRAPITMIVVAHNEADVIDAKLENALALSYPPELLEVIAVTDGSDDGTPEHAARFDRVKVLHEPQRRGKLAAMMRASESAAGEILVFSDANNLYSPGALVELVAPFADPQVGVVTGRKVIDDGSGRGLDRAEGIYWRYESKIKEWESASGSVAAAAGEMLAFRREAFPRIPPDSLVEDLVQVLTAASAGWRVVYAPDALSVEGASATTGDEATRRARLVAGRWQVIWRLLPKLAIRQPRLAWQLFSHKLTRPLIPAALLVLGLSNGILAMRSRGARVLWAAQLAFYGAALHGWRAERASARNRLTYLPYYFCRMNLATVKGPLSLLTRRQNVTWTRVRRG
jgi:poly-beta-1,6-N-acetyl-D-glucosamine synthase